MSGRYYVAGYGGKIVPTDRGTWMKWMVEVVGKDAQRPFTAGGVQVSRDDVGAYVVSTIFTGTNPDLGDVGLFFDTALFDRAGIAPLDHRGSADLSSAQAAHADFVARAKTMGVSPEGRQSALMRKAQAFVNVFEQDQKSMVDRRAVADATAGAYEVCQEFIVLMAGIGRFSGTLAKELERLRGPAPAHTKVAAAIKELTVGLADLVGVPVPAGRTQEAR